MDSEQDLNEAIGAVIKDNKPLSQVDHSSVVAEVKDTSQQLCCCGNERDFQLRAADMGVFSPL